jgi:SAM-dependent methyltransferase
VAEGHASRACGSSVTSNSYTLGMPSHQPTATVTERNDGFRSVLLRASVYQAAQNLIGARKSSKRLAKEVLHSLPTENVVDIGCGTADIVEHLEFAAYTGFDPNPPYVKQAVTRLGPKYGARVQLIEGGVGDEAVEQALPEQCDLTIMLGVLHHLDDALADKALSLAARLTRGGGRFVSFDPGLVPGQPRIAKFLITRDRGQNVRTVDATRALVEKHFSLVNIEIFNDLLNVPYTHIVVSASNTTRTV